MLHDTAEDAGGEETLAEIRAIFGDEVAGIVDECSDTVITPKPPWKIRKQAYLDHLGEASEGAVLVSLADKLDNARAILRDLRRDGDSLWQRFTVKDPGEHLWYYESLLDSFRQRRPDCAMVAELGRVIDEWAAGRGGLIRTPAASSTPSVAPALQPQPNAALARRSAPRCLLSAHEG